MSYFLCYELEKVKKEEVDFWTSRHERVKFYISYPSYGAEGVTIVTMYNIFKF